LLTSTQKGDAIGDIEIIRALSESIEPENLGRLAGDFSPKSQASLNTVLLANDSDYSPRNPNAISILGEVLNPIAMEYKKNLSLNSAINNTGGYKEYADKRRVYVIKGKWNCSESLQEIFLSEMLS
jgi:protein involved in polysaccharide export with SLBB domain